MAELKLLATDEPRNKVGEWAIRIGVATFFVIFGLEKFSDDPASHWVRLFQEIGFGNWFRYLAGFMEVGGGLLVLIPRLSQLGFGILALTMTSAAAILTFLLRRPGESLFPGFFLLALIGLMVWNRRRETTSG